MASPGVPSWARPCPSGKVRYTERAIAGYALVALKKRGQVHGKGGVYVCDECGWWHVSSMTRKEHRRSVREWRVARGLPVNG